MKQNERGFELCGTILLDFTSEVHLHVWKVSGPMNA
jgi:hypothetical protein